MSIMPLKVSTASQIVHLGPFLDSIDGVTPETGLTINNTDIKLLKHGATASANKNSGGATAVVNGWYHATLNGTDTDTLGRLVVSINMAGAVPVYHEFIVLPANVYDAWVNGSGVGVRADVQGWLGTAPATPATAGVPHVNAAQISGDATAADLLELFVESFMRTSGTAQAGGATSITFAAGDGAATGAYVNGNVLIIAGTGVGQIRKITAYNGGTKVATVNSAWTTNPDNTSQYIVFVGDELSAGGGGGDPWTTSLPGAYTAGQAGYILGNVGEEVAAGLASVSYPEPSVVPAWPMSMLDMQRWVAALALNKLVQSTSTLRLRDDADTVDVGQAQTIDSAGVFTRGKWG